MPSSPNANPLATDIHRVDVATEAGPPVPVTLTYTVPFFTRIKLTESDWRVNLGAGGNKYPRIRIVTSLFSQTIALGSLPMTAAGINFVLFTNTVTAAQYVAADKLYQIPLPTDIWLDSQDQILFDVINIAGGDSIENARLTYLEWMCPF